MHEDDHHTVVQNSDKISKTFCFPIDRLKIHFSSLPNPKDVTKWCKGEQINTHA